ncbi:MAG: hypothetical protein RBU21_23655, partial [FCB group bacterium]|nr:hypothetical protein [FCB group bacterium]
MVVALLTTPPDGWDATDSAAACPSGEGQVNITIPESAAPGNYTVGVAGEIDGIVRCGTTITVKVIKIDLDVDSDNSGGIAEADDAIEDDAFSPQRPGLVLWPNNDDSDGDLQSDYNNNVIDGVADLEDVREVIVRPIDVTGISNPKLFIEVDAPQTVQLFNSRIPTIGSTTGGFAFVNARAELFGAFGGTTLGIEGLASGRATVSLILESDGAEICRDVVRITVADLQVTWRRSDSTEITEADEPNDYWITDPPGQPPQGPNRLGVRYFPGATTPGGSWHDIVLVRVQTVPVIDTSGASNLAIYLKAIDPDDPSADDPTNAIDLGDKALKGGDNRGEAISPWWAGFETGAQGWVEPFFCVSHQPGDNHRVAASFKQAALNFLTSDNVPPSRTHEEPATQDQVELFIGNISPLLTVWRQLHVETDAMARPTFAQNTISTFWNEPRWEDAPDDDEFWLDILHQDGHDDFHNGYIRIQCGGFDDIVARIIDYRNNWGDEEVRVQAISEETWGQRPLEGNGAAGSCVISDDDIRNEDIFEAGVLGSSIGVGTPTGHLPLPNVDILDSFYAPVYIDTIIMTEHTTISPSGIPFVKNGDPEAQADWDPPRLCRGLPIPTSEYWTVYVYSAFQPEAYNDADEEAKNTKGINTHPNGSTEPRWGAAYTAMAAIYTETLDDG